MNRILAQAARATRAAVRRTRTTPPDTAAAPQRPVIQPYPTRQATDPGALDIDLLAALMLSGLVPPTNALAITLVEADQNHFP